MNVLSESSRSFWMEVAPRAFPPLDRDRAADVVVVGSGIAGLSTAYELSLRGSSVIVLDRGTVARGMTARTTAHLTSSCDDLFAEVIRLAGEEAARAYYESQQAAVDRIGVIAGSEGIDCDFAYRDGFLFAARPDDERMLDEELEACGKVGFAGVEKLPRSSFPGLTALPCLRFPRQGRMHPLRYLDGLAEALGRRGGLLFADTAATAVEETASGVRVATESGYAVTAAAAVIATNSPIGNLLAIHPKQAPYRTYVIAAELPRDSIEDVLYWDTKDPYHYVRRHPAGDRDVLIIGGEDHKSGEADDMEARLRRLEDWARPLFPAMGPIRYRWSGQTMIPVDFVGFIGRNPGQERVYVATGDSGQGITTGALAGTMLSAMIHDGGSDWSAAYDPGRRPVGAIREFVAENLTAVKELVGHLLPGEIGAEAELAPGEGGLMRSGLAKLAVCRDRSGRIHRHSATCTHAGCTVHWNSFEQCWDCPCHGSQFAPDGAVLNGPATMRLAPAG